MDVSQGRMRRRKGKGNEIEENAQCRSGERKEGIEGGMIQDKYKQLDMSFSALNPTWWTLSVWPSREHRCQDQSDLTRILGGISPRGPRIIPRMVKGELDSLDGSTSIDPTKPV